MDLSRIVPLLNAVRCRPPKSRAELSDWVRAFTGVTIPSRAVCQGHSAPFDMFARQVLERPSLALWHGPRGSGKSFLSALDTHLASRFNPRHETHVLGGSRAQSEQIYRALKALVVEGTGSINVNHANESGSSPLHYLARYTRSRKVCLHCGPGR